MGLYNEDGGHCQRINDPEDEREINNIIPLRMENDELSDGILEEEMNLDISFDDSSILWDLRQLFDPDFIVRESSPFPRGDSADIPVEVMRVVTPVHGAGCPDENNMNIRRQTNHNNINDGESRRSNTCLKNLTRVIHNSDQVKDILFSMGPRETKPSPSTKVIHNMLNWSNDNENDGPIKENVKQNLKPSQTRVAVTRYKQPQNNSSRRKKRYSSSSSSSSSESSCSCSTKRRKRYNSCRYTQPCGQTCHNNNRTCQHQCGHNGQLENPVNNNQILSTYSNQNPNSPIYNNYLNPQSVWPNPYGNQAEMVDMPQYQYTQTVPYIDPSYYMQPDMSDIIDRIHKLDLNISQLTKDEGVCPCNQVDASYMESNGYHDGHFVQH